MSQAEEKKVTAEQVAELEREIERMRADAKTRESSIKASPKPRLATLRDVEKAERRMRLMITGAMAMLAQAVDEAFAEDGEAPVLAVLSHLAEEMNRVFDEEESDD